MNTNLYLNVRVLYRLNVVGEGRGTGEAGCNGLRDVRRPGAMVAQDRESGES